MDIFVQNLAKIINEVLSITKSQDLWYLNNAYFTLDLTRTEWGWKYTGLTMGTIDIDNKESN